MKPLSGTIAALVFILMISEPARAMQCPSFTQEQRDVLIKAAYLAETYDWSFTLAAMVWQEGFWGDEIRRENPNDAPGGSWGVTQVRVTTALGIVGWDDTEESREIMRNMLVECDTCAMELALHYFMGHQERLGWQGALSRYNGSGEAAELHAIRVIRKVRILQSCAPWLKD